MNKLIAVGAALVTAFLLPAARGAGDISEKVIWSDDSVPEGALELTDGRDLWNWVASNPTPVSGALAHQSEALAGLHEHFFNYASSPLQVAAGEVLFANVNLDADNPPAEVMLSWHADGWEHRAYWGANAINYGNDGSASRQFMGALPPAGQWVRLEVPASLVELEGASITGMGFSLFDGRATWDTSGSASIVDTPAVAVSTGSDEVWSDDALPDGAGAFTDGRDAWNWVASNPAPASGALAHQSNLLAGQHEHFFNDASKPMTVAAGDVLFSHVYLDAASPPTEIMLSWHANGWEHRAYWGANMINYGNDGSEGRQFMGALPAAGQWVRLEVPASKVGLEGASVTGMGFSLFDGSATWDRSGRSTSAAATTTTPTTTVAVSAVDFIWSDDAVPEGAAQLTDGRDAWNWTANSPAPVSGSLAHQSNLSAGLHEHFFNYASAPLTVAAGEALFAYIHLDAANPPSEVMLAWNADGWEHRAYWGANAINYGTEGTASRRSMGALPAAGQWVRLEVPASQIGLEGATITGMGFSLFDGRATWDMTGKSSSITAGTTTTPTTVVTTVVPTTPTTPVVSVITPPVITTTPVAPPTPIVTVPVDSIPASGAVAAAIQRQAIDGIALQLAKPGDSLLHVLSPTLLELKLVDTKQAGAGPLNHWNFVNSSGQMTTPATNEFAVTVEGRTINVQAVGFKRRVLSAPLLEYDLRVENSLYLQLASPIADGEFVQVVNPDGRLWTSTTRFQVLCDAQRYSPAIHVNQEGYVPSLPKKAMVGYFLGDMGEMNIPAGAGFAIVDARSGTAVYRGNLVARQDVGYNTSPAPYQKVLMAEFTDFATPGEYQLQVPGLGASLPFLIHDGIAMGFARTYALGLYHQRCGSNNTLPFTRFTHDACHTAAAQIPVQGDPQFNFTWATIARYAAEAGADNPAQIAPRLTSESNQLYPFINRGTVDVSGGHHDAGDYSKYTINSAELIHYLIFTADSMPGVAAMDNLGIPESGDGISDVLQEAKIEADYIAKLQDADGGFYFLTYPKNREYESGTPPELGDAQVVWPKNTSVTAAAVAALAECASSPLMKRHYPDAAAKYLQQARLGWQFLMNAIAKHGKAGSYQKITFYSDHYTHDDELAWAACEMFLATGESQYQDQMFAWFSNPSDSATFRWGWWRMSECWGNAVRSYAFAARSGRLPQGALNAAYLANCESQVVAAGDDALDWSDKNAYATPFPIATKRVRGAGWYFSLDQASDMAVAYQIQAKPAYIDALVGAMNYEGGTNPVNVTYLTGLGLKRQREIVSQRAQSDRRVLPETGIPLGNIQASFDYLQKYGPELGNLSYPSDNAATGPYPFYDRWSDTFNVTTEFISVNQARGTLATCFLATRTASANVAWKAIAAQITVPATVASLDAPVTFTVQVPGMDIGSARVVWEARDQEPAFGSTYSITPKTNGAQWVEVEIEWPDGRRACGAGTYTANSPVVTWVSGALPTGASPGSGGGDGWTWSDANLAPGSSARSHESNLAAGVHEHWFTGATATLEVGTGDSLFAWVYIDPANAPKEIMLAWNDGSSWEHRAFWGGDHITYGTTGTAGRRSMGPLPPTGQWVKLTVPASAVGLENRTLSGMSFTQFDGRATWNNAGKESN
ncbi:MAG: glycoside hydrolase family 9 protein [Opitutaceae bacterium]|nr:glycoside hydrolase family 9 protein [Opitutaceae bacterium]